MSSAATTGRLVVVSNRLPVTIRRGRAGISVERSAGGLVAALEPSMRQCGGIWVGWPGGELNQNEHLPADSAPCDLVPVPLTATEVRRFYHGFSNRTLWPLFHSLPERTQLDRLDWECYEAVNRRFAEVVNEAADDGDLIWIHDYHLLRCAPRLRELRPDARIAFFLHVPFPPYDLYRILPWYRELLRGALACDLVGFHCPGYVSNFLDCVERLLGERVDRDSGRIEHGARTVKVADFPLGIDYARFENLAKSAPESRRDGERLVLGVDRLDYTKGIPERILAFERLLELHREHREEVVLMQIAVPSRAQVVEYQALKREIDELVGRVNGRFGTPRWSPIRYLYRAISQERLTSLYRDAEVALVTPLRDGMNLVAKEFVACQVGEPGVLVLSRMAGAAETMAEAISVNPYNVDSVAEALHRALNMSRDDRVARMRALQRRERENDLDRWLGRFLAAARAPQDGLRPVDGGDFERWLGEMLQGWPLALFLDYDGTLSEIAAHPEQAQLRQTTREALTACAQRPDTNVTIVSGRALEDVRKMVDLEGITYAGNHGLEIAGPGLESFRHPDIDHYSERARELTRALRQLGETGVWVEEKGASLTLHFRGAEPTRQARIAEEARRIVALAGFQPRDAHCAVEARPPIGWGKGQAVLHVLRERYGPAWSEQLRVVYAGDDETDEDAFRALQGLGATFRIGRADRPTQARRRLRDVAAVEALLLWVGARKDMREDAG